MSERLVLSPAASSALVALSRALVSAARTASLYPADHPVVRASAARVWEAVAAGLEAGVAGAIAVTPSALVVGGLELGAGTSTADRGATVELAALLHDCGILELGFEAPVPLDAISRLLGFIARVAGRSAAAEGLSEVWQREGHPSVRIKAVDYRTLLADREGADPAATRDDVWRAVVSGLRSGRRSFDLREQQRLMDLAGDPDALAALAETLTAEQCTPDGSPLVTTQATTILSCFRHLASVAGVIAPDRAQEILRNVASALSRLDPHVSMQVLALDGQSGTGEGGAVLAGSLSEEGLARIIAALVALEGAASPRLVNVFELLVPDPGSRRRVLQHARSAASAQGLAGQGSPAAFEAFWNSIEHLLLSYDDHPFVSDDYRVVLDASRNGGIPAAGARLPELTEWLDTLGHQSLQQLSITLLADLLRLEPATDRAVIVLNHLAALAEDLLLAGAFEDALRVLDAIAGAAHRDDLATAVAQVLHRLGTGAALAETAATIDELSDEDWPRLRACYLAIGPSALASLAPVIAGEHETRASERAGGVVVAMAEESVTFLGDLVRRAGAGGRVRIAILLGAMGRPAAIPALQTLLRSPEPGVLQAAVAALAGIDDPAAARTLHLALAATDGEKRGAVVSALVAADDRRVVPLLTRVLGDCEPLGDGFQVAIHTLDALGRLADPRAVEAVARVMMLRSWFARRRLRALKRACVQALSRIADASASGVLQEASRSGDRMLRGLLRAGTAATTGAA